jgi:SAM-dependent methyltransferase
MDDNELSQWFDNVGNTLEQAYLKQEEPWKQSGMSGPSERWVSLRKPVADCIDRSGSFLDIGCANGYLLESVMKWVGEKGLSIVPYGLDLSKRLVELAKERLPQYKDNFFVGNAFTWLPPRRFEFVRTELVYVPAEYEKQYIGFILDNHLTPGGKLLVANYGEGMTKEEIERGIMKGMRVTTEILLRLRELGFSAINHKDGYDPIKNRKVRIAILNRQG